MRKMFIRVAAIFAVVAMLLMTCGMAEVNNGNSTGSDGSKYYTKNYWQFGDAYGIRFVIEFPDGIGNGGNGQIIYQSAAAGYGWYGINWQVDGAGNAYAQGTDAGVTIKPEGNKVTITYLQDKPLPVDASNPWVNINLMNWWSDKGTGVNVLDAQLLNSPTDPALTGDTFPIAGVAAAGTLALAAMAYVVISKKRVIK